MFEEQIKILKALANGINYFTGEKCDENCILNDPKIVRSLYNICDDLKNIKPEKLTKNVFICPTNLENEFSYENELNLTNIINKIAELYPEMKKPKHKAITDFLKAHGLLEEKIEGGKRKTIATPKAKQYGIYNIKKPNFYGQIYEVVTYNKDGQKYILSILKNL